MKAAVSFTVVVDVGGESERALERWLRSWRRRGVHCRGTRFLLQGATRHFEFVGPAEALDALRTAGVPIEP